MLGGGTITGLKVPRQCSLVLLARVWRGLALGSGLYEWVAEDRSFGSGPNFEFLMRGLKLTRNMGNVGRVAFGRKF
jgi:hypothetical protein